jgi:DNA repair protein RadD
MSTLFSPPGSPRPLWPHQERTLHDLRARSLAGCSRVAIQIATGGGKTRLAIEVTKNALHKGKRVAIIIPRISLVDQWLRAFAAEGIDCVGVMQADHPGFDPDAPVQLISAQTLARRQRPRTDLVIVDEAHLLNKTVIQWIEDPDQARVWFIALSATPWTDGLGRLYTGGLIVGAKIQELIDAGVLTPFRAFAPSEPDLAGVHVRAGDFAEDELADRCNTTKLVGDITDEWLKRGEDRPTLSFAVNRAHAKNIQQRFLEVGVACEYIDACVDRREREEIFERFRRGEIEIISSVATLEVGIDLPMASCIIDARPTKSRMAFVQRIGRGLRVAPGKTDCIILDHAGNHLRLGMVTDIHQDHLDAGSKAENDKKREAKERPEPLPKLCDECKAVVPPKAKECPGCGAPVLTRTGVEHEDGELIELSAHRSGKIEASITDKAIFYAQLRGFAAGKGYADGWVSHKFKERFGTWPNDPRIRSCPTLSPSLQTRNWIKSRQIAFAKRRAG